VGSAAANEGKRQHCFKNTGVDSESTTPLKQHLKHKRPGLDLKGTAEKMEQEGAMEQFAVVNPDFPDSLLKWIIMTQQPLSASDNPYFKIMVHSLSRKTPVPNRKAVTQRLKELDQQVRKAMCRLVSGGFVACTTDAWTSVANEAFVALTLHWLTEWLSGAPGRGAGVPKKAAGGKAKKASKAKAARTVGKKAARHMQPAAVTSAESSNGISSSISSSSIIVKKTRPNSDFFAPQRRKTVECSDKEEEADSSSDDVNDDDDDDDDDDNTDEDVFTCCDFCNTGDGTNSNTSINFSLCAYCVTVQVSCAFTVLPYAEKRSINRLIGVTGGTDVSYRLHRLIGAAVLSS
jgi:hypothetical protein